MSTSLQSSAKNIIALQDPSVATQQARVTSSHAIAGLRFIASILIVLDHFHYTFWKDSPLPNFTIAVSFFFILSGYGLTSAFQGKEAPLTLPFVLKRYARLWPLHFITLLITAYCMPNVTHLTWESPEALWILLSNALLIHGWIPIRAWFFSFNIGSWSMSMLIACYLFFPTYLRVIRSPGKYVLGLILLSLLGLMMTLAWHCPLFSEGHISQQGLLYVSPLSRGLEFFIGMLLAQVLNSPQWQQSKISAWLKRPFSASLLEFSTIALFGLTVFYTQDVRFFSEKLNPLQPLGFYLSFAGISLIPCLLLILIFSQTPTGLFSRLLGSKTMVYLSTLTFGVYLIHIPMLHLYLYPVALKPHIPQPTALMLILYFAGLLGISALSYHFMEKPLYKWGSRQIEKISSII